jgi:hypothetical protein
VSCGHAAEHGRVGVERVLEVIERPLLQALENQAQVLVRRAGPRGGRPALPVPRAGACRGPDRGARPVPGKCGGRGRLSAQRDTSESLARRILARPADVEPYQHGLSGIG